jgi:hypothetical protein
MGIEPPISYWKTRKYRSTFSDFPPIVGIAAKPKMAPWTGPPPLSSCFATLMSNVATSVSDLIRMGPGYAAYQRKKDSQNRASADGH